MSKITIKLLLVFILILAFGLRVYKIAEVPKSITWDEAAVGYNGWTIANYGKDEYGNSFPLYFRSFGEDKQPIHIYITSLFVKVLGLSEFSTRLPAAVFGVLNVTLIFFLARNLFNANIGLISSLLLGISPQNIFFSRFNHEANFALFFFILGLLFFYQSLKKYSFLLPFSLISFCLSMVTYHAAEIVVPPTVLILVVLYFNEIKRRGYNLIICPALIIGFIILAIFQPRLFGIARFNQTKQGNADIEKTLIFKQTKSYTLGRIGLFLTQYSWHFSPRYLFIQGDKNPRLSSQTGEFYKIEAIFLILGFLYIFRKKSKEGIMLLSWALIAPIPSALFAEAPHAGRAVFMMGSWHIISALGFYWLIIYFKEKLIRRMILISSLTILIISSVSYLNNYFNEFANRYSTDWQYGMKQIVDFVNVHSEYNDVFMTNVRSQPYIFFLYYIKMPLPEYLNTVVYNNLESKGYNNVSYFGRYYFEGWDPIESFPKIGELYIITPSQYDGLHYKKKFDVKEKITYPNGTDAFYIISAK